MRFPVNKELILFIVLQFSTIVSAVHMGFMSAHTYQFLGNLIILMIIVSGFLIFGRLSLTVFALSITSLAIIGYLIIPGDFAVGVPLLPFIGLFLVPKHYNVDRLKERYGKLAKIISLINVILIYMICYVSKLYFGLNLTNNTSELLLAVILINILFFREPFVMTVLLSTILCTLFTPGAPSSTEVSFLGFITTHQGNRSGVFLILFLLKKEYIATFFSLLIRKRYFLIICILICFCLFGSYIYVDSFLHRHKMLILYDDPRFLWFYPMYKLLINNGIVAFFEQGSDLLYFLGDGRENPHNSFLYLLIAEYWVGLLKVVVFMLSILIIPVSAWMAISGRAFFDIFFLLGPTGIIFMSLVRVYFYERLRRVRWMKSPGFSGGNKN